MSRLTAEQVESWRKALLPLLGPIALHLSADSIGLFRDLMQDQIDAEAATSRTQAEAEAGRK